MEQKFGKYTLLERLAQGGMAEIFKATVPGPSGFEKIVAIKRLHRRLSEDPNLGKMLVDEAKIAVQLNHPNVAQVFDLGRINERYFIVMEYVDGQDLQAILERLQAHRTYAPIPAVLYVISDTLKALHYAHTRTGQDGRPLGIVHRDVSPQNIMVDRGGSVKLVDFGIAKARKRAQTTQAGVIKGKYYYMAPEQAHGNHVDGRCDVFGAGMVLYELLVNRAAYEDVPERELLREVRMANFPPPIHFRRDLDPELVEIVRRATERDRNARFSDAAEMQLAIDDYAHRKCPRFGPRDMARWIESLDAFDTRKHELERLERQEYAASSESLLFDLGGDPESVLYKLGTDEVQILEESKQPPRDANTYADVEATAIYDPGAHEGLEHARASQGKQKQENARGARGEPASEPLRAPHRGANAELGEVSNPTTPSLPSHREGSPSADRRQRTTATGSGRGGEDDDHPLSSPIFYVAAGSLAALLVGLLIAVFVVGSSDDEAKASEKKGKALATNEADTGTENAIATGPDASSDQGKAELAVNSKPANARVYVDGEEKGSTPVALSLEQGKKHQVEIRKSGFATVRKEVKLTSDEEELVVDLDVASGVLKVASFPPDAIVTLDGRKLGKTPVTETGLSIEDDYELEVRLDDERVEKRTVDWEDGDRNVKDVMIEFEAPQRVRKPAVVESKKKKRRVTRRRRSRRRARARKRRNTRKTRSQPEEKKEESFDVFGDDSQSSSKSSGSSDDSSEDEDFNVWGGSSSGDSKKESKPAEKDDSEDEDVDEDLDVW